MPLSHMRDIAQLLIILALTDFFAMAFRPPKQAEILSAIGKTEGLPMTLQRALEPGTDFTPIPVPKPGDWLVEHPEAGQTFDDFVRTESNNPDELRNNIYLQPLGQFPEGQRSFLKMLKDYGAAYFAMDVKILPSVDLSESKLTTRINPISRNRQILTRDVLVSLKRRFAADAFCILAITMEDLYPDPSWNFVFGQASLQDRVGVFSFARYDPAFYGQRRGKDYQKILLQRSCKVLVHEIAHMFSLQHCIFFSCVMNGSNHLLESDSRPMALCPVCLRKLQFSIGFDAVDRYRKLLVFYQRAGFDHEAGWVSRRLKRILGDDSGK
jgi:archaemetzincin